MGGIHVFGVVYMIDYYGMPGTYDKLQQIKELHVD
jgi:hypothetical protein